jgi:hypothetical protein
MKLYFVTIGFSKALEKISFILFFGFHSNQSITYQLVFQSVLKELESKLICLHQLGNFLDFISTI